MKLLTFLFLLLSSTSLFAADIENNGGSSTASGVACTDCVALGTETTGNYAAGDAEAGAALTGDTATAFFSAGTIEDARLSSNVSLLGAAIDLSGAEATGTLAAGRFPALTGDVTTSAGSLATAIGNDKITEAMLKAVDSPADEECLTKEDTTGDFEWQACSAGGGDSVSVDGAGVTDPNFDDGGDINFTDTSNTITATVKANSVALTTDTTGNYANGDGEAGNALTGDTATAFFSTGTIEFARGGTGASLSDPNADKMLFWDDSAGAVDLLALRSLGGLSISTTDISFDWSQTIAGNPGLGGSEVIFGSNSVIFEAATADAFEGGLVAFDVTADRTWTLPNLSGTVIVDAGAQTLTGKTIDGDDNTLQDIAVSQTKLAAGRSLTLSTNTADADAELYTTAFARTLFNPSTSDDGLFVVKIPQAFTVTEIACHTDTGTVDIEFEERAEGTPNTSGTEVMGGDLQCDSDQAEDTSFDNAGQAVNTWLYMKVEAVASSPTRVSVTVRGTWDD